MRCLNCKRDVEEQKVKLYLQVLLCSDCAEKALRIRDRIRSELESMLARMDDNMRAALSAGKFREPIITDSIDVLQYAVDLDGVAKECRPTPRAHSMESTKPSALPADGSRSSAKPSAQD